MVIFETDVIELKKIIVEKKIDTVLDLSEASGVNRNILGSVLSGKIQPSANVMYRLTDTLKIPPEKAGSIFFKRKLTQQVSLKTTPTKPQAERR